MDDNNKLIRIGYNGYVRINENIVRVKSASINTTVNIPTITPFYQPPIEYDYYSQHSSSSSSLYLQDNIVLSPMRMALGTVAFSGQVSFELTTNMVDFIFSGSNGADGFFAKNYEFDVEIYDGVQGYKLTNCKWQSINIQCNASSLIDISISFQSTNGGLSDLTKIGFNKNLLYDDLTDSLIPYWETGIKDMASFQLQFERNLTPMYLNNKILTPLYLRPGLLNVSFNTVFYKDSDFIKNFFNPSDSSSSSTPIMESIMKGGRLENNGYGIIEIKIGNRILCFNSIVINGMNFSMSSKEQFGNKSYQFKSMPLDHTKPVFTIEKEETSDEIV